MSVAFASGCPLLARFYLVHTTFQVVIKNQRNTYRWIDINGKRELRRVNATREALTPMCTTEFPQNPSWFLQGDGYSIRIISQNGQHLTERSHPYYGVVDNCNRIYTARFEFTLSVFVVLPNAPRTGIMKCDVLHFQRFLSASSR